MTAEQAMHVEMNELHRYARKFNTARSRRALNNAATIASACGMDTASRIVFCAEASACAKIKISRIAEYDGESPKDAIAVAVLDDYPVQFVEFFKWGTTWEQFRARLLPHFDASDEQPVFDGDGE